ncbi:MAG: hypothetical protein GY774_33940 [Planctomycetes bacterium]|nr:hypothetical protein [Planctomycetota bacterium]
MKLRINFIRGMLRNEYSSGYLRPDIESCALQFRKVVELLTFGLLCVNLEEYKKARAEYAKDWNAKRISDRLLKMNPNFYPRPIRFRFEPEDNSTYELLDTENGLSLDAMLTIYNDCSGIIHEANPLSVKDETWISDDQRRTYLTWSNKFVELLNQHAITLVDQKHELWINMSDAAQDGKSLGYVMLKRNKIP